MAQLLDGSLLIRILTQMIHVFHSSYFYSASSSPLLLRSAPNTAQILCWSFMPKSHKQLRVKDLPKVHTWRPERFEHLDERRRIYQ